MIQFNAHFANLNFFSAKSQILVYNFVRCVEDLCFDFDDERA